ncbi:hypothetical protein PPTG_09959 [Plasmopara halstedii]|uniref:Exocyst subunit Exo70 family protein n=1 Tax=Plasmopara halstedii TaxID=4781 RepID=A0A0P1AJX7_PLAHL|nr:hypothetical protein PPTG_09959 [Plasmopara halstedii]CEG40833.1 hypothetical protein PPTG_09959 [Plasmopara halstedii]|eukprot:XP_024577202.1 hypothetical protein PPTG_09959 [Plasmopara halstedii]
MEAYSASVLRIREALRDNQLQMQQVEQSLSGFQKGLLRVEKETLPVYKLTEQLRGTQKNIDLSVLELRRINENFEVAHELAPVLLNGSRFDQNEFVRALQKLLIAITFLDSHRSYEGSVKALGQAKELLVEVQNKCLTDFISVVSVLSRSERDSGNVLIWIKPSEHDVLRGSQLLECLLISGIDQKELLEEYGKQRFSVIKMVLTDDSCGTSIGFDLSTSISALSKYLLDIEVTIKAEKVLAGLIFSDENLANEAFRFSVHHVLESWKKDIDKALCLPRQLDATKLLLAHDLVLSRLDAFESAVCPPILLRSRDGRGLDDPWILSKAVKTIVTDLSTIAKQKLFNFQASLVEASEDQIATRDGNVHPISSHTINFLRKVCDQAKPLKILLEIDSDISPAAFVDTIVTQLVGVITAKADLVKGRDMLKQIFLVNNFSFVTSSLPHLDDADLEKQLHTIIKPHVEKLRNNALKAFIHVSYASFTEYLHDPKEKLQYTKGGNMLTLESGRLIKEKFLKFNDQLEELHKAQKMYVIVDVPMRQHVIRTAIDTIMPAYKPFYEKYSAIQFSKKHASRYLKYTPQAAQSLLKELFTGEATTVEKRSDLGSS